MNTSMSSNSDIFEEKTNVKTFYNSLGGYVTVSITGYISVISSLLIIIIILRSDAGFTRVYHRIMFGMSVCDIITSIAMALGSIPMPTDMIYRNSFLGPVLGNTTSCTVQGSFFFIASIAAFVYNVNLCIYYYLTVRWKITNEVIRKRYEPYFHIAALVLGTIFTVPLITNKAVNPSPYSAWCAATVYPYWCDGWSNYDEYTSFSNCSLREGSNLKAGVTQQIIMLVLFICGMLIMFFCIGAIIVHFYQQKKLLAVTMSTSIRRTSSVFATNSNIRQRLESRIKERRAGIQTIIAQASLYLLALVVTQFFPLFALFDSNLYTDQIFQIIHLILKPLQGFFNLIIFVSYKAQTLRKLDPSLTKIKSYWLVFASSEEPVVVLSNLSLVRRDRENISIEGSVFNEDEDDEEEVILDTGADENIIASSSTPSNEVLNDTGLAISSEGNISSNDNARTTTTPDLTNTVNSSLPEENSAERRKNDDNANNNNYTTTEDDVASNVESLPQSWGSNISSWMSRNSNISRTNYSNALISFGDEKEDL